MLLHVLATTRTRQDDLLLLQELSFSLLLIDSVSILPRDYGDDAASAAAKKKSAPDTSYGGGGDTTRLGQLLP